MSAPRHLLEQPSAHNLGQKKLVQPNEQVTLLDLAGDDAAARSLYVVLVIDSPSAAPVGTSDIVRGDEAIVARALVEFGNGGHRVPAIELDVRSGLAFTVSASSLRVNAINDGTFPVEIGAFVSHCDATPPAAALTRVGESLGPSESWTLDVPPFAASVEVLALDALLRVEVGFGRAGAQWLYSEDVAAGARMLRPLPIANGCGRVRVTNRGTSPAVPLAIFTLAF